MRIDKDNTRRIGGLMLDLLMLSFIISLSLADIKIIDRSTNSQLSIKTAHPDQIIVGNSFKKIICSAVTFSPFLHLILV
ncbi:MAG: hypothetical protein WKF87_03045 [Chryseolinea sp.]